MLELPDKLITDNARYFTSEEFTEFMMNWNIVHLMSSPRYPQGNSHAEKAVHMVKSIYEKCHDIKMGLLLLKLHPWSVVMTRKLPVMYSSNINLRQTCQSSDQPREPVQVTARVKICQL